MFLLPAVLPPMRHARSALDLSSTSVPRLRFSTVSNNSDRRKNRGRHPHCPLDGGRREAKEQDQERHEYRRLREDCQRCSHLRAGEHCWWAQHRRAHDWVCAKCYISGLVPDLAQGSVLRAVYRG